MLTKETVEHVSKLARLKLSEQELIEFSQQLSAVLENFEQLAQVDTKDVQPLITPTDIAMNLREDEARSDFATETLLRNASEKSGGLFKVPPVV